VGLAEKIWNAVTEAGKEFHIGPVGLGARDTLRLEMGFCLYGHDIDQSTNPLEAGLGWITKLEKGEFVGRNAIRTVKAGGLRRKLVGFSLREKAFPRQGYTIHSNGTTIGAVTSGTFSPTLDHAIGMGYVDVTKAAPGNTIGILIRGKQVAAAIVSVPFVKKT
jgi:aminomethyltransferase